jgi:hypothetical protein
VINILYLHGWFLFCPSACSTQVCVGLAFLVAPVWSKCYLLSGVAFAVFSFCDVLGLVFCITLVSIH